MPSTQRYTTDQVLRGIQYFLNELADESISIDPEKSVYHYHPMVVHHYGCPLEFLCALSDYFGLRWSEARWVVWLQLPRAKRGVKVSKRQREVEWEEWKRTTSPCITVLKLAEYIARHARGVSMLPVTVFGQNCGPAGAFRGLCALPEVRGKHVAPSTRLRNVMGAWMLVEFWKRAEWVTNAKLPELRKWSVWPDLFPWMCATPAVMLFASRSTLLSATVAQFGLPSWLPIVLSIGFLFALMCWFDNRFRNPLPSEVETFGDLARLIAGSSGQA